MNPTIVYAGAGLIILWGIAHLVPTASIVKGFGDISQDNRRILTMEWIAEGLFLCFIGALVWMVTTTGGYQYFVGKMVYYLCSTMLIILAAVSFMTGAKTNVIPMKICPYIKVLSAVLINIGS